MYPSAGAYLCIIVVYALSAHTVRVHRRCCDNTHTSFLAVFSMRLIFPSHCLNNVAQMTGILPHFSSLLPLRLGLLIHWESMTQCRQSCAPVRQLSTCTASTESRLSHAPASDITAQHTDTVFVRFAQVLHGVMGQNPRVRQIA